MSNLTPLSNIADKTIKVSPQRSMLYAEGRHMMALNVAEVSRAIVDFPVLISRIQGTGSFSLSALTSFEPNKNVYLSGGLWGSSFLPSEMQTFPFQLLPNEDKSQSPVIGAELNSPCFSGEEGEALFDGAGQPALWVSQIQAQLVENAKNAVLTDEFFKTIDSLNLHVPIVISLHLADGPINKIGGLSIVNEDKLKSLTSEQLAMLNEKGFLGPLYAMLFSIFQLNSLIRKHNETEGFVKIAKLEIEIAKSNSLI